MRHPNGPQSDQEKNWQSGTDAFFKLCEGHALEKEQMILNRFDMLPKHMKSVVMTKAKQMVDDYIADNKLGRFGEYTEKYILDGFIVEIMENDYGNTQ